jgi:hypothetical protein
MGAIETGRLAVLLIHAIKLRPVRPAVVVAMLATAPLARAQEADGTPAPADALAVAAPRRVQFDEQAFVGSLLGGANIKSIGAAREILEDRLDKQLAQSSIEYNLTPQQKDKLALAGRGDIKRFLDRVDEACAKFRIVQGNRKDIAVLLGESKSFRTAVASGVFTDGSLFAKTFAKVVNGEQIAHAARFRLEREQTRYREAVVETVGKLSRCLSLTNDQRQRFVSVLIGETKPPQKSGDSEVAFVMFQAARLPRAKLEPLFDEDQRGLLWKLFEHYENIEDFLKDDGFVFDVPPAARHSLLAPGAAPQPDRPDRSGEESADAKRERTTTP